MKNLADSDVRDRRKWVSFAAAVLVIAAMWTGYAVACPCRTQAHAGACELRGAVLYKYQASVPAGAYLPPQNDVRAPKFVYTGFEDYDSTRSYKIEMYWGKGVDKNGQTSEEDFIRCFTRDVSKPPEPPPAPEDPYGWYDPKTSDPPDGDPGLEGATLHYPSSGVFTLYVNGHEIEQSGSTVTVTDKDEVKLLEATYNESPIDADSYPVTVDIPPYFYTRTVDAAHNNRITKLEVKLNGDVIRNVYTTYTEASPAVSRMRITVETFDSDGDSQFSTTIYGYYTADGNKTDQVHFVVQPDGVTRYLLDGHLDEGIDPADPGAVCGLDNVATNNDLLAKAAVVYNDYDGDGRVTSMTGRGCGGCGGMGEGTYLLYYGTCEPPFPDVPDDWNKCTEYRRTVLPSGACRVEFTNKYGAVVFDVRQTMDAQKDIVNKWITQYKYGTTGGNEGKVIELRHPSACTSYGTTTEDEGGYQWIDTITPNDTGTAGLVELSSYDANENLEWTKVRKGTTDNNSIEYYTAKYTYTSVTYGGQTVWRVATETSYPTRTKDPDAADKLTTSYAYTYFQDGAADTHAVKTMTVTPPAVSTAHNGSGAAGSTITHYNRIEVSGEYLYDWAEWAKSPGGSPSYTQLDSDGQVVKTIRDVDTDETTDFSNLPAGWSNPDGVHLITVTTYDDDGRTATVTDPGGRRSVYAYTYQKQTDNGMETTTSQVTLVASHMDDAGKYDYGPLQISVSKTNGDSISAAGVATTSQDGDLTDDWDPAQSHINDAFKGTLTARTDSLNNDENQLQQVRRYHNIPTGAGADGLLGDNYYLSWYRYDSTTGRKIRDIQVVSGTTLEEEGGNCVEQVTKYVYDQLGRSTEIHKGVSPASDSMAPNFTNETGFTFKKVSANWYDEVDESGDPEPGSGTSGVGDGYVTSSISYYDAADYDNNVKTIYYYDYRGMLRGTAGEAAPYAVSDYDNMGRTTATAQFISAANFGAAWATVLGDVDYVENAADTNRRTLSKSLYDELGRVYRTETYAVYQSGANEGQAYDKLISDSYYDEEGRLAGSSSPGSGGTEHAYDGAGRQVEVRTLKALKDDKYEGATYAYRDPQPGATSGGNDGVISITRSTYDETSSIIKSLAMEANHDDTDGISLTAEDQDYIQSGTHYWQDILGRSIGTASYGSGDADNKWKYAPVPARAAEPPAASSAGCLVTRQAYDSAGRPETGKDPKGHIAKSTYDDLGRTIKVVENYVESPQTDDQSRTTCTQYDGLGSVTKQIADIDRDDIFSDGVWTDPGNEDDQTTLYLFEDNYSASLPTNIIYPDSSDTDSTGFDQVKLEYNLDRTVATRTSQKAQGGDTATMLTFVYDDEFHRLTQQRLNTNPSPTGVDTTIQSIKYTYDALGRREKVASYASADCTGDPANEIQYAFNDLGALDREYQAHTGAVNTETTPYVGYNYYTQTVEGVYTKGMRLKSVRYPSTRLVHYRYGAEGSRDEMISRLATIHDDDTTTPGLPGETLAAYSYNGPGSIVAEEFPTPGVKLDYFQGTSGTYAGLDRFARVKDQKWIKSTTIKDRHQYGYDYNSNRTYRKNALTTGKDWAYTHDGLDRLATAHRGVLDDPPTEGLLSKNFRHEWDLDPVGNWTGFNEGTGDTWTLEQIRTSNLVNEITNITQGGGQTQWVVPAHDAPGNMKSGPKPGAETTKLHFKYDAWNRLVEVRADDAGNPGTIIVTYRYDAAGRRIRKLLGADPGNPDTSYDYYYNNSWQCLEIRKDGLAIGDLYEQYIWSVRYIDSPVLRDRDTTGNGELDERLYYLNDANFNVTALVNTSGTVVERYVYDAYGKVTIYNADWSATVTWANSKKNEVLYCGYRYNPETGLYHVRNRCYHPTLGCWLQRDPLGYEDGMSLYEYVGSRPESQIDTLGLCKSMGGGAVFLGLIRDLDLAYENGDKRPYAKLAKSVQEGINDEHNKSLQGKGRLNLGAPPKKLGALEFNSVKFLIGHTWVPANKLRAFHFVFVIRFLVCEDDGKCAIKYGEFRTVVTDNISTRMIERKRHVIIGKPPEGKGWTRGKRKKPYFMNGKPTGFDTDVIFVDAPGGAVVVGETKALAKVVPAKGYYRMVEQEIDLTVALTNKEGTKIIDEVSVHGTTKAYGETSKVEHSYR